LAVPGVVRGLGALHGRYGRAQWSALLAPAEQMARLGWPVSRAYVQSIAEAGLSPAQVRDLRALVADAAGLPLREGQIAPQLDLANTIAGLRTGGPGEASGVQARFVAGAAAIGGKVTAADLRTAPLPWREPLRVSYGNAELLFAPTAAGEAAGRLWTAVPPETTFSTNPILTAGGLSDALAKVYGRANLPGATSGATTFTVIDNAGQTVACLATMGQAFGARKLVPGTGILAAVPLPDDMTGAVAAIAINAAVAQSFAAAGASGGGAAAAALVQTLAASLGEKVPARQAIERPRLFRNGFDAVLWHEAGLDETFLRAARANGVNPSVVPGLARVSLIHCPGGMPRAPGTCRFEADPRAFGLGASTP
jgi:gamma-glutamyltranspeptidase/glutathione hydrolase